MNQEDIIDELNELLRISRDGEQGYRAAAEAVRNSELDSMFSEYAKQRAGFAQDLEAEIKRLGGDAKNSGTVAGTLHRGWMDLKVTLSGGSPNGILAACESGDDSAEAAYAQFASTDISGKTRALIERQWQQIKEAHTRVRRLKNEVADGAEFQNNE